MTVPATDRSIDEDSPAQSFLSRYRTIIFVVIFTYFVGSLFLWTIFYRVFQVLARQKPQPRSRSHTHASNGMDGAAGSRHMPPRSGHLLIVLGSGGHTSEMLRILQNLGAEYVSSRFGRRTWVVSSGDGFSAARAREFEESLASWVKRHAKDVSANQATATSHGEYVIATVHRARRVHQSIATTPVSALMCLWDCARVLRGTHPDIRPPDTARPVGYPDLILTNGPGTAVIVVLASFLLMLAGLGPISPSAEEGGAMRSIYIESWARVKTLSLSGEILRLLTSRFLVQWRGREDVDLTRKDDDDDDDDADGGNGENGEIKREAWALWRRIEYVGPVAA